MVLSRDRALIALAFALVDNKEAFAEWIWITKEIAVGKYGLPFISYTLADIVEEITGISVFSSDDTHSILAKEYETYIMAQGNTGASNDGIGGECDVGM
jgi:hypothetical protein